MCVITKIEKVQYELMKESFKKSGYNNFNKREYLQLKDILPAIIRECHNQGLVLLFNFSEKEATLDVTNATNKDEFYRFSMPMPKLESQKGGNLTQTLGANTTYLKRYLLMNAFLIIEDDVLDALEPHTENDEVKEEGESIPSVVNKALIQLNEEGAEITRTNLFQKCKEIGLSDDSRNSIIEWINQNINGRV